MTNDVQILRAVPVLEVANVESSINWYSDMLGFSADPFPESPPFSFAVLQNQGSELMLRCGSGCALQTREQYNWDVYLRLAGDQIRSLYARLSTRKVISRRLERMFYGLAEFEITDPDGYVICLSEELDDMSDLPAPEV